MSKNIWIIHQYASTPETGMGGRHYYLAEELAKLGFKVFLIASNANHLLHKNIEIKDDFKIEKIAGFNFVWVKMKKYNEAHSKQRAINWFIFPWKIQKLVNIIEAKPDVILCSSPSPIAFLGAERLSRKFNAKLFFEVRDIWPLTLIELGGYSSKHPFIKFMSFVEKRAYKNSYKVISNLKNSVLHMKQVGMKEDKFVWIPNGFSLNEVSQKVELNELSKNAIPKNKFIVGYTGTLGVANSLDTLIESANILKNQEEISFVIVGKGKEKESLLRLVKKYELENVYFLDSIPKIEIQSMLKLFDVCYIGWIKDELYKFGIGANKISEYLYSSKPILHSYSGECDPIKQYYTGITVEAQNPQAVADAILELYNMPKEQRNIMGQNGKKIALEEYEYSTLAKKLSNVLFE